MSDPTLLAFDTSGPHLAVALLHMDAIYGDTTRPMAKGQAEHLMDLLHETLDARGLTYDDLDGIGVGIGPGNFTGIRISVSAARGLALALGIPAVGVSSFEIMRDPHGIAAYPAEIVSVAAPRDMAYVQHFRYGIPQADPLMIDPENPPQDIELPINMRVRGFRADEIAKPFDAEADTAELDQIGWRIARVAEWKLANVKTSLGRPSPLYVRPADAAPPKDPAPTILP